MNGRTWRRALALALGAAVSLGLARFSYALLLPTMRADLGWSYFTGGAMNTANAAGYLIGALLAPRWLARHDARTLLVGGGVATALLLAAHGLVGADAPLVEVDHARGALNRPRSPRDHHHGLAGAPVQVFDTTTTAATTTTTVASGPTTTTRGTASATTTTIVDEVPVSTVVGPEENVKGIVPPKGVEC